MQRSQEVPRIRRPQRATNARAVGWAAAAYKRQAKRIWMQGASATNLDFQSDATRERNAAYERERCHPVRPRRRLHPPRGRRARPVRLRQVLAGRGHPRAVGRGLRRVPRPHRPVLVAHGVPRLVHARHHRHAGRLPGGVEEHRREDRRRVLRLPGRAGAGGAHPRPVRPVPRRAARG